MIGSRSSIARRAQGAAPPGEALPRRRSPFELLPRDTREIRAARWATRDEIQGPIRAALLATGHALFRYRVALTDATFAALDELSLAEGAP